MSSYYYDQKTTRAEKEEFDADIRGKVEQIRIDLKGAGYRPLLKHLKRQGIKIGERRLRRILGESGLFIKSKKQFVRTTQSDHDCLVYPNLIKKLDGKKVSYILKKPFKVLADINKKAAQKDDFVRPETWVTVRT